MGVSSWVLKLLAKQQYKKSIAVQASAIHDQSLIFKKILKRGEGSLFATNQNIKKTLTYQVREKNNSLELFL